MISEPVVKEDDNRNVKMASARYGGIFLTGIGQLLYNMKSISNTENFLLLFFEIINFLKLIIFLLFFDTITMWENMNSMVNYMCGARQNENFRGRTLIRI